MTDARGPGARWGEVVALFERALAWPEADRERLLDRAAPGDPELRRWVAAMLRADGASHPLFDASPGDLAAAVSPVVRGLEGRRFGPYTIVREIGRGGMGEVYLAERTDVEMRVALKLVPGVASKERIDRFLFERRVLAQLEHPHIARLLDAGVDADGTPWLAMEYVDGEPIDAWCDGHRLGLDGRLALFERVCDAVAYAHRNLVVHRDLKPSNIMVTRGGEPRLVDFGIAKLLDASDGSPTLTRAGSYPLTPRYASPEQLSGGAITTASDVYQLGVLLFELLTGRHPHGGEPGRSGDPVLPSRAPAPSRVVGEAGGSGSRWRREPSPGGIAALRGASPERLRRRLEGDLDAIVLMALRAEPERRYASAQQLADDIRRHRAGQPVLASPDSVRYRARKFVGRNRAAVAAGVVVAATLLAGMAGTTWQARRATREARVAAEQRDRANTETAKAERVAAFLGDLFRASDPGQALGREVTAREILDEGARRLAEGEELADEPAVRAELLHVLGGVYRNLGWSADARRLQEQGLALRRAVLPADHPDIAESLTGLAASEMGNGRPAAARLLLEEALTIRRAAAEPDLAGIAQALHNLGTVHLLEATLDTAELLLRDALDLRRRLDPEGWEDRALTLSTLAATLSRAGRAEAADSFHAEALALQRERRPPRHPELARALNNVATARLRAGDPGAAEPYFREALAIWREVLGRHPDVAVALNNLGSALERQGKLEEAEAALRESLALKRETLGPDHAGVASTLNNLGTLLGRVGKDAEAESLLEESLALRRRLHGEDHPAVATALRNLAEFHERRGRLDRAVAGYERALAIRRERMGPDHRLTLESTLSLAAALAAQGDTARSVELLDWVGEVGQAVLSADTGLAAVARRLRDGTVAAAAAAADGGG